MIPMHLSDEQAVNSTMMMVGGFGRGAFRLARWISRHQPRGLAPGEEAGSLLKDALSVYRGGEAVEGRRGPLQELIRDLSGTEDISAGQDFVFTGSRGDLSYFWRRSGKSPVFMPAGALSSIPDPELKTKTLSVLAEGVLKGELTRETWPEGWSITVKGEREILKMPFVKERLKEELHFSQAALAGLEEKEGAIRMDRIDQALKTAGIDPARYAGCGRATLNKNSLFIGEQKDGMLFYIPGTGRREQMLVPKSDLLKLDQKTYAVFFSPEKDYFLKDAQGGIKALKGKLLFKRFDNKSSAQTLSELKTLMDKPEDLIGAIDPSRAGEKWILTDQGLKEHLFTAKGEGKTPGGGEVIILDGKGGGDLLLPKEAIGAVAVPEQRGEEYLKTRNPEEIAGFWEKNPALSAQLENRGELIIRPEAFEEKADCFVIGPRDTKGFMRVSVSKGDCRILENGSLAVELKEETGALLKAGSYSQSVTREGAQSILKSLGGKAMEPVALAEAAPALLTTPVSAGAKVIMEAAKTASQAVGLSQSLSQRL